MSGKSSGPKFLWLIGGFFFILLAFVISPGDYSFSRWLMHHNIDWFSNFMDQSFYEGEPFGAGDIPILFMIAATLLYIASWFPRCYSKIRRRRPELGFLVLSAVSTCVCVVHGLKWTVGRARPTAIFNQGVPFTHWFEPGPFNAMEQTFRGSFPSGHTAVMTFLISGAYLMAFSCYVEDRRVKRKALVAALIFSVSMAFARTMTGSHFITDCLAVIGINWLIIHALYFFILDIPAQKKVQNESPQLPIPFMWEMRMSLYLLAATVSLVAYTIGFRDILESGNIWSGFLVFCGLQLFIFFLIRLYFVFITGRQFF